MDKRILILLGIVLILLGFIAATLLLRSGDQGSSPNVDGPGSTFPNTPDLPSNTSPEGEIRIPISEGSLDVRDFRNDPGVVKDEGQFHRMYTFRESSRYQIAYSEYDNGFLIALLAQPLASVRLEAEQAFLETLGISKDDACKLKVSLGTVDSVDVQYAGKELGLSFCRGAVALPN